MLSGNCVLTFTQRIITTLREKPMDEEMKLSNKDEKNEIGRINFNLQFIPSTFEQQVI